MPLELLSIFGRTVLLYFTVLILMRIMGKREVGQLSLFDLVVAIMIAELGAIPSAILQSPFPRHSPIVT